MDWPRLAHRKGLLCSLVALSVIVLVSVLYLSGALVSSSLPLNDVLYDIRSSSDRVVVIAVDDKSLQEVGRWPWDRDVHAELIGKLGAARVIGVDISFFENSTSEKDAALEAAITSSPVPVVLASEFGFQAGEKSYLKPIFDGVRAGHVNILPDPDGVVRSLPARIDRVESFSAVVAQLASKRPLIIPPSMLVAFFEPPEVISYVDVLRDRASVSFDDAIVLVGVTAPDFHDDHLVPVSKQPKMAGVVVHANAVRTILASDYLVPARSGVMVGAIVLLAALAAVFYWRLHPLYASLSAIAAMAVYFWLAFVLFSRNAVIELLHPLLAAVLTGVGCIVLLFVAESAHKRRIASVFGKYVSKAVAAEILDKAHRGEEVTLSGKRRTITVLFGDVRGFTPLSERLQPEEVVALLNRYLGDMTQAIFDEQGTIDKYIGDAIMALWNAPLDQRDHAVRAVRAALAMQASAAKHRETGEPLFYGIGVNTGPAVVGNIGSKERLEYTAIGDAVNLASRLCGKAEAGSVFISEETFKSVKDKIVCEKVGPIEVKGKKKPVIVYKAVRVNSARPSAG